LPEIEHTKYCVFFLLTTCLVWPITLHVVPADACTETGKTHTKHPRTKAITNRRMKHLSPELVAIHHG
jgi:hypothetical protein